MQNVCRATCKLRHPHAAHGLRHETTHNNNARRGSCRQSCSAAHVLRCWLPRLMHAASAQIAAAHVPLTAEGTACGAKLPPTCTLLRAAITLQSSLHCEAIQAKNMPLDRAVHRCNWWVHSGAHAPAAPRRGSMMWQHDSALHACLPHCHMVATTKEQCVNFPTQSCVSRGRLAARKLMMTQQSSHSKQAACSASSSCAGLASCSCC